MASDTTSHQTGKNYRPSQLFYPTSKATRLPNGGLKWGRKKRIEYQDEQVEEVQNFIRLWSLISAIRKKIVF